jgi:hypothetical protein
MSDRDTGSLAISATDMPRFSRPTICRSRSAGRYAPCGGLGRTDRGEPSLEKDGGADALGMGCLAFLNLQALYKRFV